MTQPTALCLVSHGHRPGCRTDVPQCHSLHKAGPRDPLVPTLWQEHCGGLRTAWALAARWKHQLCVIPRMYTHRSSSCPCGQQCHRSPDSHTQMCSLHPLPHSWAHLEHSTGGATKGHCPQMPPPPPTQPWAQCLTPWSHRPHHMPACLARSRCSRVSQAQGALDQLVITVITGPLLAPCPLGNLQP